MLRNANSNAVGYANHLKQFLVARAHELAPEMAERKVEKLPFRKFAPVFALEAGEFTFFLRKNWPK